MGTHDTPSPPSNVQSSIIPLLDELAAQPLKERSFRSLFGALGLSGLESGKVTDIANFPLTAVERAFSRQSRELTKSLLDEKCAATLLLSILRIGVARSLLLLMRDHFKTVELSQSAEFRVMTFLAELEVAEAMLGVCCEGVAQGGASSGLSAAKLHKCARGTLENLSALLVFLEDQHRFLTACPAACEYLAGAQVGLQKIAAAHTDGLRVTKFLASHMGLLPS